MGDHRQVLSAGGAWGIVLMPVGLFVVIWGLPHFLNVLGFLFGLLRAFGVWANS